VAFYFAATKNVEQQTNQQHKHNKSSFLKSNAEHQSCVAGVVSKTRLEKHISACCNAALHVCVVVFFKAVLQTTLFGARHFKCRKIQNTTDVKRASVCCLQSNKNTSVVFVTQGAAVQHTKKAPQTRLCCTTNNFCVFVCSLYVCVIETQQRR
jgi:hypothetical protein